MERDQEWFEKHAKKCNTCGNIPTMVQVTDLFKVNQVLGYKVYCEDCKWEWGDGWETRICKSPENAVRAWNRKIKKEKDNEEKAKRMFEKLNKTKTEN